MPRYLKKIQVLLTETQYKDLEEIASKQKKKLGTLVREAVVEYHIKKKKEREIAEAVDRILSIPDVPAAEDYQEWEKEYLKSKYSS
jgi:hypothetical protein